VRTECSRWSGRAKAVVLAAAALVAVVSVTAPPDALAAAPEARQASPSAAPAKQATPVAPEGRRAFVLEDLYRVRAAGAPALSPDGRLVAYTVTVDDFQHAQRTVEVWRTETKGGTPRRIAFAEGKRSASPAFSPDGRTLVFVSDRAGDPQLYAMPVDGGEPEVKTKVPGGISGPLAFTPDGRSVVFAADVDPACGAERSCNEKQQEAREKGKLKAHVADTLLYRHWTSWKDGQRTHLLAVSLEDGAVRDLTPGDFDSPTFGDDRGFDVSPDGKEIAFASNRGPDPARSTNSDVWTLALGGSADELRAPRNLTAGNPAWDGTPRYSPDGRWLAWRTQKVPGYEADRFRLAVLDRRTGEQRVITEAFDNWVRDFAWAPDSQRILFLADVAGRTPLHELDLASERVRVVSAVGAVDAFEVAPDASFAVVARRRVSEPSELYRIDLAAVAAKGTRSARDLAPGENTGARITSHNEALLREVDLRPAEEMTVKGADGAPVQVWIVKPHGFDPAKKYPLILNVHGGPQMQWTDSFRGDWQVYPGAGYVVAFPNPHGSTGFGQEYTRAISGGWDGKVMEDLSKVTDALAALPYVDAQRMGAMGWSWGGYAMMWLEGHETRFKALAAMMGVYDLRAMYSSTEELWFPEFDLGGKPWERAEAYRATSPSSYVESFRTPCLVLTGMNDFRVPYTQSLEFFTDLQLGGVPSRLVVFEKAGHWPSWYEMGLYYAAHLDWFHRWLGGSPSPWDPVAVAARSGFSRPEPAAAAVPPPVATAPPPAPKP
jgi:dipeptidyl aminopeptidase/acylaminoacyl peptidase